MKKVLTRMLPLVLALLLVFSAVSMFSGCGGGEFVFEAEDAALGETTNVQGESGPIYNEESGEADGPEAKWVSYFGTSADFTTTDYDELIWKVTASKDCTANFTLVAASASTSLNWADWTITGMAEIDFSTTEDAGITCNDVAAKWDTENCILGGQTFDTPAGFADVWIYRMFQEVKGTIDLKKGENTIILYATKGVGINVDKLIIDSEADLEFTPADNGIEFPEAEEEA